MNFYLATWLLNIGLLFSCMFAQGEVYTSNEFKQHHYERGQDSDKSSSRVKMHFDRADPEGVGPRNSVRIRAYPKIN